MAALDHQLGIVDESTYGTPVVVTKFFEYNDENIDVQTARTEGDPLIKSTYFKRYDRFTPYVQGASGPVDLDVMSKGFGYWLKHMFGGVATTGPTETSVYTHTSSETDLYGKFFTTQVNKMFHPAGTAQAYTFGGCKITEWELKNSVDENLVCSLSIDSQNASTAVALATASYPASMENLTWAGGTVTIGGSSVAVSEISVKVSNNLDTGRRFIQGSTLKKEPTGGRRECTFSIKCDFESLTQYNRVVSTTRSGALAAISATWSAPTLLGSTIYPNLKLDIAQARFDDISWDGAGAEGATSQTLSGVGLYDGTNNTVKITYQSADVTP